MNNSVEKLNELSEWIKMEYNLTGELYAKSHDNEEKKRLHAEHGMLHKVLEKLNELNDSFD